MYVIVYSSLILLYMINVLAPFINLSYIVGVLATVALLIAMRKATGLYLVTGAVFLVLGIILFIINDLPYYTFFMYFESMLGLLSLFLVLPFINCLIHVGHFDRQLNYLLNLKTKKLSQLYTRGSFVSHVLGVFINIATIPLITRTLRVTLKDFSTSVSNRFYSKSILRGYALCLTWSPFEILLSTVIDATNTKYYQLFPIMLIIAFLFLALNWKLFNLTKDSKYDVDLSDLSVVQIGRLKRKLFCLAIILLLFIFTVSIVELTLQKGYLLAVVLVIIPFSLLAAFVLKKLKQYLTVTIPHWKERTLGLSNYFFMFLSAGLFVGMLTETPLIGYVQGYLVQYAQQTLFFYLLIACFFLITALIGFHPLVSLVLFISILEPIMYQLNALPLSIVLVACTVATVMYSPFNLSVSIMSNELKVNPYKIMSWNIGFAISYVLFSIAVAYGINFFY